MNAERQGQTKAIAEIKERVQLTEWQRQIEERQAEGIGVTEWCERQGISKNTYYYRLRRIREYLCQLTEQLPAEKSYTKEERRIVPINMSVREALESRIEIKVGELSICFTGEISPEALRVTVEALRSC